MSRVTPMQSSFNGGEVSPRISARVDQSIYAISVAEMVGFVPTLQGPAEACPGFIHVAQARDPHAILLAHEFTVTQGYVIEATAGIFRFYTNEARIEISAGVAMEVAHPYSAQQLRELTVEQAGEYLYLYHRDVQTRRLARTGATSFVLEMVDFANGPFERRNADKTKLMQASGVTGAITVTANFAAFDAGDVGGLLRIEAGDLGTIRQWSPRIKNIPNGTLLQHEGRVYKVVGGTGQTGDKAPVHAEGIEWDGIGSGQTIDGKAPGGVQLQFIHDRIGIMRVTGYINAQSVSAEVLRHLPFTASTGYSWGFDLDDLPGATQASYTPQSHRWSFGVFSPRRGWPECGCIAQERHIVGRDNGIYGSVVGDFGDFSPLNEFGDVSTDMGFTCLLRVGDRVRWIKADKVIMVGTDRGEYLLIASSSAKAIGPGNIEPQLHSEWGSEVMAPIRHEGRVLFVDRSRRRLMEFGYSVQRDRYDSPDLLRMADHLADAGLSDLAYMASPQPLLWAVTGDGGLLTAAYEPKEQLLGWSRRALPAGVKARSVAVITASDGGVEQLWLAVDVDGVGHVVRLGRFRSAADRDPMKLMLDLAVIGEAADGVTRLAAPHLAGRHVDVIGDGIPLAPRKVSLDGVVTIDEGRFQRVVVGLAYPARITLLPFESGGDNGTAQGKKARIDKVMLRLLASDGVAVSVDDDDPVPLDLRLGDSVPGVAFPLFTGDVALDVGGDWDVRRKITIMRTLPKPVTLLGLIAYMTVQQSPTRHGRGA